MIRLAIAGATGRTGRCALELASRDDRFEISAALTKPGCPTSGTTLHLADRKIIVRETLDVTCDVLIDFTVAAGTIAWLEVCTQHGIPMVIGATGHDDQQLERIKVAARAIPLLKASNFSIGIQTILNVIGNVAKELGKSYDVEIIEAHHRYKIDAPSGTALTLADEIAAARGRTRDDSVIFGRRGQVGERPGGQIGVHAVRMGELVGSHEIHFSGPGETITIRHTAHSRDTFAAGALRAAAWIVGKPPGFYTLRDAMD